MSRRERVAQIWKSPVLVSISSCSDTFGTIPPNLARLERVLDLFATPISSKMENDSCYEPQREKLAGHWWPIFKTCWINPKISILGLICIVVIIYGNFVASRQVWGPTEGMQCWVVAMRWLFGTQHPSTQHNWKTKFATISHLSVDWRLTFSETKTP